VHVEKVPRHFNVSHAALRPSLRELSPRSARRARLG
jgi:hypothetical protein